MKFPVLVLVAAVATSCAPLYSQNTGLAHRVKRGMTAADVRTLLGNPALAVSIDGVDEWRYCSTRLNTYDEIAIVYFQNESVIDKTFFSIGPDMRTDRTGDYDSCLGNINAVYEDKRHPPKRVQAIRERSRNTAPSHSR